MDYASEEIASYEWRPSIYYPSPARQVTPVFGPWGIPYKMLGIEIQNTNFQHIEAPIPPQKSIITHPVYAIYNAGQYAFGQAPTSGVYTGVSDEDCT